MSDYSKVARHVWHDDKFRRLSAPKPNARTLWFFLLTNPFQSSLPGLFSAGETRIAEAVGNWSLKAFRKCWNEIVTQKMATADWSAPLVWVPKAVIYDPPANPNVSKSWGRILSRMPECELRAEAQRFIEWFLKRYEERLPEPKRKPYLEPFQEALVEWSRIPVPSPSPLPDPSPSPSPAREPDGGREREPEKLEGQTGAGVREMPKALSRAELERKAKEFQRLGNSR